MSGTVAVAGGSGDLGTRIVRQLQGRGTAVRVLSRTGGFRPAGAPAGSGVEVVEVAYDDGERLTASLRGVDAVVSALSGPRSVVIDAQRALLHAAVAAGVPRFIPSDYSADHRRIAPGSNRNLELRREFAAELDAAPIAATSVLNGAFTDLLTGQAPLVVPRIRRVLYWSDPDQVLDFTTKDDTARTVAHVALDTAAPRVVEIAGDRLSARDLAASMTAVTGTPFRLQWAGTVRGLGLLATGLRATSTDRTSAFPAWQGMQYLVSMFSGQARLRHVDNDRYGVVPWTTATDVLREHFGG